MTKLNVDDDGLRDPYTKAVERFLELFEDAFPDTDEKRVLVQLLVDCSPTGLFYKCSNQVDSYLLQAMTLANKVLVPARDRVMLSMLYQDCLRYSALMSPQVLNAQRLLEKAYSQASTDERALLASLAGARDDLFETPDSKQVVKSFDSAVLLIVSQRRSLKRSATALFKDFVKSTERFNHPALAR